MMQRTRQPVSVSRRSAAHAVGDARQLGGLSWATPLHVLDAAGFDARVRVSRPVRGIEELTARLDAHWAWLGESGSRQERLVKRAREVISAIAVGQQQRWTVTVVGGPGEQQR